MTDFLAISYHEGHWILSTDFLALIKMTICFALITLMV
jgi:hypothetical protein